MPRTLTCGVLRTMSSNPTSRPQRLVSEPRLIVLALLAGAVGMLGILAIVVTDDAWIVIVTVAALLAAHERARP